MPRDMHDDTAAETTAHGEPTDSNRSTDEPTTSRAAESGHHPVLLRETMEGLNVQPGAVAIDGTLGGGGHTAAILQASAPDGVVLGLDADPAAVERVSRRFPEEIASGRLTVVHANFADVGTVARLRGITAVDAILLDLGVSSYQLDVSARGFSFQHEGPLDMRMDPNQNLTAAVIINKWPESDIADVLYEYGEERKSRRIARRIVAERPIYSTKELAEIVQSALGGRRGQRIHPATRTFQALRIAVNRELGSLEEFLPQALELLRPGGRLAVIAFHSLEDRIVKKWMQREAADFVPDPAHPKGGESRVPSLCVLTRKPIVPTQTERSENPRSRSAKLRVAEKILA